MIFDESRYLFGLIVVPVALAMGWWVLRRTEKVLAFFSSRPRFDRATVVSALLLEAVGFGLLFCALAGPEREETADELASRPLDVVVALDVSLSMWAEDVAPNRLGRARRAVRALIDRLVARGGKASPERADSARLGVVEFAGTARVVSPLTRDFRVIDEILPALDGRSMESFGSDLASGLDAALGLFDDPNAARAVIVVTDGEHRGDSSSFEALIDAACSRRVSVFALVVGTSEGARIPLQGGTEFVTDGTGREVLSRSRTDLIDRIVQACGGERVTTQDKAFPMDALFEDLAERAGLEGFTPVDLSDRSLFQWFLLASLLCFLASLGLNRYASLGTAVRVPFVTAALILGSCGAGEGLDRAREGDRFFQEKDFAGAGASFERALTLLPDHDGIVLNLGLVRYCQRRYGEAAVYLGRAADSTDRRVSLPARFSLGLCDYRSSLGALERAEHDHTAASSAALTAASSAALKAASSAALKAASSAARRGAGIFEALARDGFRPADSRQNEEVLLDLVDEIDRKLAELESRHDNGETRENSSGDAARESATQVGDDEAGGLTAKEAPRRSPEASAAFAHWADDPGTLSLDEIRRIYARLDELKRGRQSREAHRAGQRLTGEVDW